MVPPVFHLWQGEFNTRWQQLIFNFMMCIVQLYREDGTILVRYVELLDLALYSNNSMATIIMAHIIQYWGTYICSSIKISLLHDL